MRPEAISQLRLACALGLLMATGMGASAALAEPATETPAASMTAFASAFADIGPAQIEVLAEPHAVDVTEVLPGAPATPDADTAPARLLGSGVASYYGRELAGRRTASGEVFDPAGLTAAHRTLPFGSRVRVTNPRTGQSVVVRINDRGPFTRNRLIDLSQGAAQTIGLVAMGHGEVQLELLEG